MISCKYFLPTIGDLYRQELRDLGVDQDEIDSIIYRIDVELRRRFGCNYVYIASIDRAERARRVIKEFDGTNRDAVCEKYGISRRTFYRFVQPKSKLP